MILVDMNQVTISNLMMQIGSKRQNDVDGDMVRHMGEFRRINEHCIHDMSSNDPFFHFYYLFFSY